MVKSTIDVDNFSLHLYRKWKHLSNSSYSLKDFTFNLSTGLLQSMSNPYFQNVLFSYFTRPHNTTTNDANSTEGSADCNNEEDFALQVDKDPSTLYEQLQGIKWPISYKVRELTRNPILKELCLTRNDKFMHEAN
jgi:hypothetical protein